ncbi:MAG TPA: hypothetical protein VKY81_09090 [Natronosporangium sp.]|nr:hypothetical protein [Natronosporangium sp.]
MKQIWRPVVVALSALVLATGCSGGGGGDGGGGADLAVDEMGPLYVNNCELLTDAEVSELAGEEVVATADVPGIGCKWEPPGEANPLVRLLAVRSSGDSATYAQEELPNAPEVVIELEGIGDDAVAVSVNGGLDLVIARKGDLFVEFDRDTLSWT